MLSFKSIEKQGQETVNTDSWNQNKKLRKEHLPEWPHI